MRQSDANLERNVLLTAFAVLHGSWGSRLACACRLIPLSFRCTFFSRKLCGANAYTGAYSCGDEWEDEGESWRKVVGGKKKRGIHRSASHFVSILLLYFHTTLKLHTYYNFFRGVQELFQFEKLGGLPVDASPKLAMAAFEVSRNRGK